MFEAIIFQAIGLDTYCLSSKKIYSRHKLLTFDSFDNNMNKKIILPIECDGFLHQNEEKLIFNLWQKSSNSLSIAQNVDKRGKLLKKCNNFSPLKKKDFFSASCLKTVIMTIW